MGIFDVPRLHVSGRFYADPSSVNNDPDHYLAKTNQPSPWQMPYGRHHFRFEDCAVMSALGPDGQPVDDSSMVGQPMQTTNIPMPGRIVDLDVYQQAVTQLLGLKILIGDPEGNHILGSLDTPVMNGNSFNMVQPTRGWKYQYGWGSYGGDSNAIGLFQSVLRVLDSDWKFPDDGPWGILRARCQTEILDGQVYILLNFKFLLDGYWNVIGSTDYQYGRMTGTISPQTSDQPREVSGPRWLEGRPLADNAAWYVPFFYRAPFHVDETRKVLSIDWSGSVSRLSVGGDPAPLGTVTAKIGGAGKSQDIGPIRIDAFMYSMHGGISEVALTQAQIDLLKNNPLELWTSREDIGDPKIMSENPAGWALMTQNRSIRMPSDPEYRSAGAEASVYITQWGKPVAGKAPGFKIIPITGTTPGITVPPGMYPGDTFQADGALTATVTPSDDNGIAKIEFQVLKDPGSRTTQLDGQIYFCYAYWDQSDQPWLEPRQESQISVLVWESYPVIENPGWDVIQALMEPYQKIYPGMAAKFHLADKTAFDFYANNPGASYFMGPGGKFDIPGHPEIQNGTIPYYMTLPFEHPQYMPVSRDLSPNKVKTVLNYISAEQKIVQEKSDAEEKKGNTYD